MVICQSYNSLLNNIIFVMEHLKKRVGMICRVEKDFKDTRETWTRLFML